MALKSIWLLFFGALAACGVDNRTGRDLGNALANGPIRTYGQEQSLVLSRASLDMQAALAKRDGSAIDLASGREAWARARVAFDRAHSVYLVIAPDLQQSLDGRFDDPLARTGLRQMEGPLFSQPPAPSAVLSYHADQMARAALRLGEVMGDPGRSVELSSLLSSLSAVAAVMATKVDGSESPWAGLSHLSIQSNLLGFQAVYGELSPLVVRAKPELDAKVRSLLLRLSEQVASLSSVDTLANKVLFLTLCDELSQAFLQMGPALGLTVAAPIDVT